MFDVEGTLSVLVTFPALLPGLKKMENSIYCAFVEVDISKNKFEKSEEEENKITYRRRFQRVGCFGIFPCNDWSVCRG